MGLKNNLNVIIVSDKGINPINKEAEEGIALLNYIDRNMTTFLYKYGPLGLVEPLPGMEQQVYDQLKSGSANMQVMWKDEIPEEWHYKNNKRVPQIVVLANPGYQVHLTPQTPGFGFAADNGYAPTLFSMHASYWSVGPNFRKDIHIGGFDNVHIYPLMCDLLGLIPAPNNGSLDVLIDTLTPDTPPPPVKTTPGPDGPVILTTHPNSAVDESTTMETLPPPVIWTTHPNSVESTTMPPSGPTTTAPPPQPSGNAASAVSSGGVKLAMCTLVALTFFLQFFQF